MRHNSNKVTLGRRSAERKALLRGLAENLVLHESIRTTSAKARAVRGIIEPLVTKARRGTLADLRAIKRVLYTDGAVKKMMEKIGPQYKERNGGYTRITKMGVRVNDASPMVRIEFV